MKHIGRFWGFGFGLSMLLLFSGCGDSTDPCEAMLCNTPPANYCDGDSTVVYANDGTCADGSCSYTSQTVICDEGCSDGACNGDPCAGIACDDLPNTQCYEVGSGHCEARPTVHCEYTPVTNNTGCDDSDPCTNTDLCTDGTCGGVQKTCNTPPADECQDGDTLTTYQSNGLCSDGICGYPSDPVDCEFGCAGGACNGDPCIDILCDNTPADYCDGDSLMQYPELGVCDGGNCSYIPDAVICPYGCADRACNPCPPDCSGLCGGADDGCDGTCTADCPAGQYCDNQLCVACTVPGACGESCEDCTGNTAGHDCISLAPDYVCGCDANDDCGGDDVCNGNACCTPNCEGKACGPDDCGGTCTPGCAVDETCHETTYQCVTVGEFVTLEAGTFEMGSPEDEAGRWSNEVQHTVTLSRDFRMLSTEVTQGSFEALMGYNPSIFTACGTDCPVENVTWYEAAAYCNALSVTVGFVGSAVCYTCRDTGVDVICEPNAVYATPYDCPGYRLPTEAEWEYAARAGTITATYNGDVDDNHLACEQPNDVLDPIAWICGNSGDTTHAVGTRAPNDWDLYDMLGNVFEWCHDLSDDYPAESATDPWGPRVGFARVLRGGSWFFYAGDTRAARRATQWPDARYMKSQGFRLVRSLP